MRFLVFLFLLGFLCPQAKCESSVDSLLNVLKSEISNNKFYDDQKESRLIKLKQALNSIPESNIQARYALFDRLYEEYKDFVFDSAHVYAVKLLNLSNQTHNLSKHYESKIKLGTIQLSLGMFKETFECINHINPNVLNDSVKLRYYELKSRAYTNLTTYNTDEFYSHNSNAESLRALDSAILLSSPESFEKYKYMAERFILSGQNKKASVYYLKLLQRNKLTDHQRAMIAHDLSNLSVGSEKMRLIILAAINDIRSKLY